MIKYYAAANGCRGYENYIREAFCENTVVIADTVREERAELVGYLKGECTELIMKAGTTDDFDGVVTKGGAVIFGGADYDFFGETSLMSELYGYLNEAKSVHDDWEKIYISNMNFDKAQKAAELAVFRLIGTHMKEHNAKNTNRFFGTLTEGESVNFIDDITAGFEKRIFIKGRPGTGKSTLLKHVRSNALMAGFDTETYLCSFDPCSLDMVAIRELGVCIFDSTAPHEMFPSRTGDEILDIYEYAVNPGTDEKYNKELTAFSKSYNDYIKKAKKCVAKLNNYRYEREGSREKQGNGLLIKEIVQRLEQRL